MPDGWVPVQEGAASAWKPVATPERRDGAMDAISGFLSGVIDMHPALHAAAHPINTVREMWEAQKDQYRKAVAAAGPGHDNNGDLAGFIQHAAGALLPVAGPMASNFIDGIGDKSVDDHEMGKRLGQIVALKAQPEALEAAGKAVAPVIKGVAPALPEALRTSAERQYSRVLGPTTKANKFKTAAAVPELIDRGVTAGTLKGLQGQAQAHIASLGESIGDAWDNLPAGTTTELEPVYDRLQSAIDDVHSVPDAKGNPIPKGPEAERAIGNINRLQQTLMDVSEADPATGKLHVPVEKVRALRQYFDDIAARAGRYGGKDLADQSAAEAHGLAADAIRNELAKDHPDIASLNKEYSFWKNVDQVVGDTIQRKQGQSKPLGQQLARAAGFIKGGILGAEAMDALTQATRSPAWGTVAAILKDRLADSLAAGNIPGVNFFADKIGRAAQAGNAALAAPTQQTPQLLPAGSQ